ncbi:CobQ/CobB/MinD/ParA nucleotide binding domain-containing protein [Desulfonema limicola]|uniref:CobQ/CobB/MinD/ParA nucleotide binding domain-containing protein n=1 Tax=Desulfonema limicola TaxID=45656 RepID=A0A975BCZ2_9BACT|nr:ATP-binding protein [Desulfonema limicola]QTA82915.1 CobQ/CobB/MinD/ParA nucleotide binding domain-containing protein [Desulfonema limicola]
MIISIASGKGGTGKTTVATSLALSLQSGVQLLDCDVEEPNCHLFLNPEFEKSQTVFTPVPEIDKSKCSFCRKCVDICRFNVIALAGETVLTFPELCHSCGGCMAVCPEDAITEVGREIGTVEKGRVNNIDFVYGRLRVGEAMSPPLIKKVRSYIQNDKINIIDAPPGTSCPVIAAMNHTDFVLLVTEPTPFGLHDLKLAVEAVKILNIPHGLVINRSDMGDTKVKEYAEQENIPILLNIPFDRKIAEAYSKGRAIVEQMPEWKDKFLNLYARIKKITDQGAEQR